MAKKIIKFKQENCVPCRMVDEFIDNEIKEQVDETYMLFSNDEKAVEKAQEYGIMQTPTLLLVDEEGLVLEVARGFDPGSIHRLFEQRNN